MQIWYLYQEKMPENARQLIIELKCDKTAEAAVKQIKDRRYEGALAGYKGKLLLVGINYDSQNGEKKHHTCVIEEYEK